MSYAARIPIGCFRLTFATFRSLLRHADRSCSAIPRPTSFWSAAVLRRFGRGWELTAGFNRTRRAGQGFTVTDLLAIIAIVSVLLAIFVAHLENMKRSSRLAQCTANLGQVDKAVLEFCAQNGGTFPGPSPDARGPLWWWYKEQVKRFAGCSGPSSAKDKVFACPNDRGYSDPAPFHDTPRFDYGSYVFNGVTLPGMPSLAGLPLSRVLHPKRTLLVMEWTAHAPLSWHNSKTGRNNNPFYCDAQSAVGFVDGHVSFTKIYYDGYDPAYTQDPIEGYEYQYSPK